MNDNTPTIDQRQEKEVILWEELKNITQPKKLESPITPNECATTINIKDSKENEHLIDTIELNKIKLDKFIIDASKKYNNKFDYSQFIYCGWNVKGIIVCNDCGTIHWQSPNRHLFTNKICGVCKIKQNTDKFIIRATELYGDKFGYSNFTYYNNSTKSTFHCNACGNDFDATAANHLKGSGCPYCYGNKKKDTGMFIREAIEIHGTKFDYSKFIYINCNTEGTVVCNTCKQEFLQRAGVHLKCVGCPCCFGLNKTTEDFILQATNIHEDRYSYAKFIYNGAKTKGIIICNVCKKEFSQTPDDHLHGYGCPKCAGLNKTTEDFILDAVKIHGDKYDYLKFKYKSAIIKGTIICKKCKREFLQNSNSHLSGAGCPYCFKLISKPELEFLKYCNIVDDSKHRQVRIKRFAVDGLLNNVIYEFLGDYYHGNPSNIKYHPDKWNEKCSKTFGELYKKTFNKFKILNSLGYRIKYIWETDWNNFKKGIDEFPKILEYSSMA